MTLTEGASAESAQSAEIRKTGRRAGRFGTQQRDHATFRVGTRDRGPAPTAAYRDVGFSYRGTRFPSDAKRMSTCPIRPPYRDGRGLRHGDRVDRRSRSGGSRRPKACASATDCGDSDPCTDDYCDPVVGCMHSYNTASCTDPGECMTGGSCLAGFCAGTPVQNGTQCSVGTCQSGICTP